MVIIKILSKIRHDGPVDTTRDIQRHISEQIPPLPGDIAEACTVTLPSWVHSDGDIGVHGFSRDYGEYTVVATSDAAETLTINPTEPFSTVEVQVVGYRDSKEMEIAATLETVDRKTERQSARYRSGNFTGGTPLAVRFETSSDLQSAELTIEAMDRNSTGLERFSRRLLGERLDLVSGPRLSLPAIRGTDPGPPIIYISVDTFRGEFVESMKPLLDVFDGDAVIPSQPRGQAGSTRPSHASTFTGTLPGRHGYVTQSPEGKIRPIDKSLTTLPEFLAEQGYKCSGIAAASNLGPKQGFLDGFYRYQVRQMDWRTRNQDASTIVNQANQWLEEDTTGFKDPGGLFYFLHFFDAHYPYVTPEPLQQSDEIDHDLIDRFGTAMVNQLYQTVREDGAVSTFSEQEIEQLKQLYRDSLTHLARKLVHFQSITSD